jgi:ribose transport system ATP-binding protein
VVAEGQLDSFTPRDLVAAMTGAQGDDADLQTFSRPGAQAGERPLLEVVNMRLPVYNGEVTLLGWPGEILGIAGLQGQGQSEFLRVLYGAWPGWTVNLCVDGQEVTIRGIADAVRSGFAFISGDREGEMIFPSRSIWENLKVVSWALSRSGSDDVTGIARHLGLGQYRMSTPASRLSGGSQQKLAVGRWMAVRPRVILADDPTRGVDVGTRREIHNFLRGMAAQGSLVLFSSSQDSELVDLCSRVYVMYRGRLVAELHGEQVKEHEIAATSMQATLEA